MKKLNIKSALGNPIVKGILKEAVSYVPVIGDNLANTIENKVGTGVAVVDSKNVQAQEMVGKVIVGGLFVAFIAGWITMDDLKALIGLI